jgi:hypothetical protein
MARFVDRLIHDAFSAPVELIVDPSEDDLVDVRHRRLRHYWWSAFRLRQRLPRQEDIGAGFLDEIADFSVIAVPDRDDHRLEVYGRALARAYGRNMKGQRLADFPPLVAQFMRSIYAVCRSHQVPVFTLHTPPPEIEVETWLRLVLPLEDADARIRFLACSVPLGLHVPLQRPA